MNGKEALEALNKNKIVKRKDYDDRYLKMHVLVTNELKCKDADKSMLQQFVGYYLYVFKDDPFTITNSRELSTNGSSFVESLEESTLDEWEIYIPFFDYLNIKGYNGFKASIISERDKLIKELQNGYYDIITAKTLFAEYLTDILYHQIKRKLDENVLDFIDKFALSKGADAYNNVIQPLFRSGYCYYFAIMLKDAFNDEGELCLCCPYGHIVWMYKGVPYDIEGVYNGEADLFIPLRFLSTVDIMSFKHVLTDEELGGELDAEYKASVINTFCDSFLKDLGFGGIFEEALEEGIK